MGWNVRSCFNLIVGKSRTMEAQDVWRGNFTLRNTEAHSKQLEKRNSEPYPSEGGGAGRGGVKASSAAPGRPDSTARLTPESAARSAAVSAPPGTRAPPLQPPPCGRSAGSSGDPATGAGKLLHVRLEQEPRQRWRRRGPLGPGARVPASPQRHLPGGERAAARIPSGSMSTFKAGLWLRERWARRSQTVLPLRFLRARPDAPGSL